MDVTKHCDKPNLIWRTSLVCNWSAGSTMESYLVVAMLLPEGPLEVRQGSGRGGGWSGGTSKDYSARPSITILVFWPSSYTSGART